MQFTKRHAATDQIRVGDQVVHLADSRCRVFTVLCETLVNQPIIKSNEDPEQVKDDGVELVHSSSVQQLKNLGASGFTQFGKPVQRTTQ